MSNTYFQFKQFIIHQDKAALKVCTDACVLGAIATRELSTEKHILDIGTGTGLLSLMLAQVSAAAITGIDIHAPSVEQARQNMLHSPWHERLQVIEANILEYNTPQLYDYIISNPPFFENDLPSQQYEEQLAKHCSKLSLSALTASINRLLSNTGKGAIMIPARREEYVCLLLQEQALPVYKIIRLTHHAARSPFRSILLFGRTAADTLTDILAIKDNAQEYTPEFMEYLRSYYLYL